MSGFGGLLGTLGGSQQKTNRKIQLQGASDLGNIFNFALPQAEGLTSGGAGALGGAQSYWQSILSGNRPAALQAIAPGTNAALSGADAARKQAATSGTARGGGVAGTNQQQKTTTQATIDNALFGARSDAAKGLTQTGSAEVSTGGNLLSTGATVASDLFHGPGSSTNTGGNTGQDLGDAAGTVATTLLKYFGLA